MYTVAVEFVPVDLSFQEWLKITRARAGLTQSALGKAIGVKPQTVSNWETGFSVPTLDPDQMEKFCSAMRVSFDDLVLAYRESSTN